MLHSLTLIAALFIGSCAHDEADLSLAISNDVPYNSMENYKSLTALGDPSLYERPVGSCTVSGGVLHDCRCSTRAEVAIVGLNGTNVVVFVCGLTCGRRILREADGVGALGGHHGGVCHSSSLGPTACRSGRCCVTPNPKCLPPMLAVAMGEYGTICMYKK
ncbi:hypothetical protein Pmar_PMAR017485 [Perkinsus marinus ATCC 50983]|uniref:Uncharacterized protein n=1 Tax=Perkinsus marinus (strain ATCC 50983 / TXsc) TaxID=423536 RepID=C5KG33_PERM5|nr:hypothetical protein Pmar_PMAR017485 [Perkinsus marinus ATCC 50983]EER16597.1 hypothetical protein Pmar_PMAR017485 [Perkinsus marinus ATCC 50983]|eukprot:XP_002784801.1 hypothetical protein Pmar_PMAR017485 [Perkinsus marinus ATCC 50983]